MNEREKVGGESHNVPGRIITVPQGSERIESQEMSIKRHRLRMSIISARSTMDRRDERSRFAIVL